MVEYILYYYPGRGRAEQIRLTLAYVGASWKGDYAPVHDGPVAVGAYLASCRSKGGNFTTNLPMLEVVGEGATGEGSGGGGGGGSSSSKFYCQSEAIMRWLGRKYKLYNDDVEVAYVIDKVMDDIEDLRALMYKCLYLPAYGMLATTDFYNAVKAEKLPNHLQNLTRMLGEMDYFTGSDVTVADLAVYDVLAHFVDGEDSGLYPGSMKEYPKLKAFCDRMAKLPNVAAYLSSEQHTSLSKFTIEQTPCNHHHHHHHHSSEAKAH